MNGWDILILLLVAAAVVGSVVYLHRQHKKGKCVGCAGCSGCKDSCNRRGEENDKK